MILIIFRAYANKYSILGLVSYIIIEVKVLA